MQFQNWDTETRALYHAIRRYRKACGKYIAGNPSPEIASKRLESNFESLQSALSNPIVVERLRTVIDAGATQAPVPLLGSRRTVSTEDMALEIQFSSAFGLRSTQVADAISCDGALESPAAERIVSPDDLIERIEDFHDTLIATTEESRSIGLRSTKKKRKRNIAQAVTSILFGTGCGVANTYAIPGMPIAATSYAVTLAAFHAAARDIVGEKPKD